MQETETSNYELNEIVDIYIKNTFNDNVQYLIYETFRLLDEFNLGDKESDFIELIMYNEFIDDNTLQDSFINELNININNIIEAHGIILNQHEVSLQEKIYILDVLNQLQYLNDYTEVLSILESDLDSIEKLSEICSQLSLLRKLDIYRIIENIDNNTLDTLKSFIYGKVTNTDILNSKYSDKQKNIINNIKLFKQYLDIKNLTVQPAGIQMVEMYVRVGMLFENYLEYINDNVIDLNNTKTTSLNILSILLISLDGSTNPLLLFKQYSNKIIDDMKYITPIYNQLVIYNSEFEKFKAEKKLT